MRRARERLKNDSEKYEEVKKKDRERYHKKKEAGELKSIKDLTRRDQKAMRNQWKIRSQNYRNRVKAKQQRVHEFIELNTPPASPAFPQLQEINITPRNEDVPLPSTSRSASGKRTSRRNRDKRLIENKQLKEKVRTLEKKLCKYKTKISRLKSESKGISSNTPRKRVARILRGRNVSTDVRKRLIFGEALCDQIQQNSTAEKSIKSKRQLTSLISGNVMKKYRFKILVGKLTSRRTLNPLRTKNPKLRSAAEAVSKFLHLDENSRLTAGKKETITTKKVKKQVRLLNDSMKNLHKKYVNSTTHKKLTYPTFCKLKPFWVIKPNAKFRETCLCKIHTNIALVVDALKKNKIINEQTVDGIMKTICCDITNQKCLERTCDKCYEREVEFNNFEKTGTITYATWRTKKVIITIKNKEKTVNKTVKETVCCKIEELCNIFRKMILRFMKHHYNMLHQFRSVKLAKENLKADDVLLHMDFSENYNCKYGEEIQSAHFGGSKPQISLHTSVLYYKITEQTEILHESICTFSENLRHDPVLICAHLAPLIPIIKEKAPNLNTIHFVSDGPATQYRNKTMFQLVVKYIGIKLNAQNMFWHFSESGHGKGAPDGVGGCVKRTADTLVNRGKDIGDFDTLLKELKENCRGITIIPINNEHISEIEETLANDAIVPFKGTMNIHQLSWSKKQRSLLQARRLSCFECPAGQNCSHYRIGQIPVNFQNSKSFIYQ